MHGRTALLPTGITMEYALDGPTDAPVLAFVHGLGSNLHQFAAHTERFGDRYRVLLLSLRGHGGTSNATPSTADADAPAALHSGRWTYWLAVGTMRLLGVAGLARLVGASASKEKAVGAEPERA